MRGRQKTVRAGVAVGLVVAVTLSMTACGGSGDSDTPETPTTVAASDSAPLVKNGKPKPTSVPPKPSGGRG